MTPVSAPTPSDPLPRWMHRVAWGVILGVAAWCFLLALRSILRTDDPPERRFRDFLEFYNGARALIDGVNIYDASKLGYIYPPLLAFLLMPLATLPIQSAALLWLSFNALVCAFVVWRSAREAIVRFGCRPRAGLAALVAAGGLIVIGDRLHAEVVMQQSNLLMLATWLTALMFLDRRPVLAGLALGLGANIKYVTLLAVPYLLLRRRWAAAISAVASTVLLALLPALVIGWSTNLDYLGGALGGLHQMMHDEPAAPGVAKIFRMFTFGQSIVHWAATVTGSESAPVVLGLTAAVAGAVAAFAALIYRANRAPLLVGRAAAVDAEPSPPDGINRPALVLLEWTGLIVAALAFSPQTNQRHYVQAMPLAVLTALNVYRAAPGAARWLAITAAAVLGIGLAFPPAAQSFPRLHDIYFAWGGPSWALLASYLLTLHISLRALRITASPQIAR